MSLRGVASGQAASPTPAGVLTSQVVTGSTTLTSASPYRVIVNSASASTVTFPTSPVANEIHVVTNVGTGLVTVSYTGRAGTTTKTIAQDNANAFAYNAQLKYWTLE
jgi:hypothetical protein